jgi:hypothetical protein
MIEWARNIPAHRSRARMPNESHPSLASPARPAEASPLLPAAGLSFTAALIHATVAPAHFAEYWAFGIFFAVIAALQLIWAELARRGASPRILWAGAAANLAVALIWLASRTIGLPIGPDAGQAEGLGLHDLLATLDELGIATLVAIGLAGRRTIPASLTTAAWVLAAISFFGALIGNHGAG